MENARLSLLSLSAFGASLLLGSCSFTAFKFLEETLTVHFLCDGEELSSLTITQFQNAYCYDLPKGYVYTGYTFFGWTAYDPSSLTNMDTDKYIADGDLIHYADVKGFADEEGDVYLSAFMLSDDQIITIDYYLVIGWYAKTSTSGLAQAQIDAWLVDLDSYLMQYGASEEDLSNIDVRAYEGDVATSAAAIVKDGDVDIFLGGGKAHASNMEYVERDGPVAMGSKDNRYNYLLSEDEVAKSVFTWLKTEEGKASLA